jgi:hypothetical protein
MVEISEEEYTELKKYKENKIIYSRNYFQDVIKQKYKVCECCNKEVKYHSFSNHLNSKKHLLNIEKIKNI